MHRSISSRIAGQLILCAATGLWLLAGTAVHAQSLFDAGPQPTSSTNVGYIDTAYVGYMFRLRYDTAYGNNFPDRAEFFYAKCGCFRALGADLSSPGPGTKPESNVDFQTIQADVQLALTDRLALLTEFPVRWLNAEQNDNTAGFGDMQVSLKYALVHDEAHLLTLQLRTYVPTGDSRDGLGTNHVSVEPGVLYFRPITDQLTLEAEVRDWIPIGGSSGAGTGMSQSFAGNVLRYGIGLGFAVHENERLRVTPVVEMVGWSVLSGIASRSSDGTLATARVVDASGDTIVNAKFGLRVTDTVLGSFYAGYGRALTGDVWYEDIFRAEYRLMF